MTILTFTASKPTRDSKLGIAFTRSGVDSPLIIKTVKRESIFAGSALRAGMIVDTVLGEPMTWMTPKDAADALRAAEAGTVTLTVQVAIGEILKPSRDAKLGIALKNSTTKAGIYVSKINEDGLFADTELKPDMKVLYINDQPCPNNTKLAIGLIKDAESTLTLICVPTDLVPPPTSSSTSRSMPAALVEEKKDDMEHATNKDVSPKETMEGEEQEDDPDAGKGIIDKIFATCIC